MSGMLMIARSVIFRDCNFWAVDGSQGVQVET